MIDKDLERTEGIQRHSDTKLIKTSHAYLLYVYLIPKIEAFLKKYAQGVLLDIGCGNKPYKNFIENNVRITSYLGCDIAQSSKNCVDLICEATAIPIESETIDTVFTTQVLEHVFDHQLMLSEANRVLKINGCLILSAPQYWHIHEAPYDFFRFTKFGIEELLKKSGFEIIELSSNGGKYALLGLSIIHCLPKILVERKIFKFLINSFFSLLDRMFYDDINTANYTVVAKKIKPLF